MDAWAVVWTKRDGTEVYEGRDERGRVLWLNMPWFPMGVHRYRPEVAAQRCAALRALGRTVKSVRA